MDDSAIQKIDTNLYQVKDFKTTINKRKESISEDMILQAHSKPKSKRAKKSKRRSCSLLRSYTSLEIKSNCFFMPKVINNKGYTTQYKRFTSLDSGTKNDIRSILKRKSDHGNKFFESNKNSPKYTSFNLPQELDQEMVPNLSTKLKKKNTFFFAESALEEKKPCYFKINRSETRTSKKKYQAATNFSKNLNVINIDENCSKNMQNHKNLQDSINISFLHSDEDEQSHVELRDATKTQQKKLIEGKNNVDPNKKIDKDPKILASNLQTIHTGESEWVNSPFDIENKGIQKPDFSSKANLKKNDMQKAENSSIIFEKKTIKIKHSLGITKNHKDLPAVPRKSIKSGLMEVFSVSSDYSNNKKDMIVNKCIEFPKNSMRQIDLDRPYRKDIPEHNEFFQKLTKNTIIKQHKSEIVGNKYQSKINSDSKSNLSNQGQP